MIYENVSMIIDLLTLKDEVLLMVMRNIDLEYRILRYKKQLFSNIQQQ